MFSLIAAIGKNRELGKDGKLLFHIPEDMKYFKETTMGNKILMGRKTWDSLPKKLPGRENIVISRNLSNKTLEKTPDFVISDLSEFIKANENTPEEIFVIGGGMLYKETLKHAKNLYLTKVDKTVDADTYFPDFDKTLYDKTLIKEGNSHGLAYAIFRYTLKK